MDIVADFREVLGRQSGPIGSIYRHLFDLLKDKDLKDLLEYHKGEFNKNRDTWFYDFHRSMRQSDLFQIEGYRTVNKSREYVSVGGKLDMILWNTIHLDRENILQSLMERIFKI